MAQSVADDLKAIGIDASWKRLEAPAHLDMWNRNTYDLAVAWACAPGLAHGWDPYAWLESFHSKWLNPIGELPVGGAYGRNSVRYSDPEFDRLIDQLTAMKPEDPAAGPTLKRAQEIWLRDLPVIGTLQTIMPQTFDTRYWKNYPTPENPYMTPFHWFPHFLFVLLNIESTGVK